MRKPRIKKRSSVGDRAVAIGGFLTVLLTGFFGAEPPAQPAQAAVQMVQCTQAPDCTSD